MRNLFFLFPMATGLSFLSCASGHAEPAAIVENVIGDVIAVRVMDILDVGATIELSDGQGIVLGYLKSCVRERIEAGRVIIGEDESVVYGGNVTREEAKCQSEVTALPGGASEGAALVFRGIGKRRSKNAEPLRYLSPILVAGGVSSSPVRIERLDHAEARRKIMMSGPVIDLAVIAEPLTPGGTYRIHVAGRKIEFSVDKNAISDSGPILERVVKF